MRLVLSLAALIAILAVAYYLARGPDTTRVEGTLTDPLGAPLESARVRLLEDSGVDLFASEGVTDSSGRFVVEVWGRGPGKLVADKAGFGASRPFHIDVGNASMLSASMAVQFPAGIEGTLVNSNGAPIANRHIEVVTSSGFGATYRADAAGRFQINDLPPGDTVLSAWPRHLTKAMQGKGVLQNPAYERTETLEANRRASLTWMLPEE